MSQAIDPRLKIFLIAAAVLMVGGITAGVVMISQNNESVGTPRLKIESMSYDFGEVSMANGLAKHNFIIQNEGDGNLKIFDIKTSCMCTSAILEINGKKSPKFGMHNNPAFWQEELAPGAEATLEVIFDPNAHGPEATGPITRSINIITNNDGQANNQTTFTFTANVIK